MDQVVADVVNNTRILLDPLFKKYPTIKVVQFGYDIVTFDKNTNCRNLGRSLFPDCNGNIPCCNEGMSNLQKAVDIISSYYPQHTSVDLRGAMQAASSTVPPPYPNYNYYSPNNLMNDCIHPTTGVNGGFEKVFDSLWEKYFKAEIEGSL